MAIIIIGTLASLAIPRLSNTIEKSRIVEAISILETLRNAQELFNQENSGYAALLDDLDVTIPASQNFETPVIFDAPDPLASIERNAGGYRYTLTIDIDGTVRCGGTVSPASICARLSCAGGSGDECN